MFTAELTVQLICLRGEMMVNSGILGFPTLRQAVAGTKTAILSQGETEMLAILSHFDPQPVTTSQHSNAPHPRLSAIRQRSSWVVVPEWLINAKGKS